jgi:hypothetical protein
MKSLATGLVDAKMKKIPEGNAKPSTSPSKVIDWRESFRIVAAR